MKLVKPMRWDGCPVWAIAMLQQGKGFSSGSFSHLLSDPEGEPITAEFLLDLNSKQNRMIRHAATCTEINILYYPPSVPSPGNLT